MCRTRHTQGTRSDVNYAALRLRRTAWSLVAMKNKLFWSSKPDNAWKKHLLEASKKPKWMEKGGNISAKIPLSQRELFALIILAHLQNGVTNSSCWRVGYDSNASEPNDGLVFSGKSRINVEHKLVPQMANDDVLKVILDTYEKYAKLGKAYGSGRTLIIFGNKQTRGLIKISSLKDQISGNSPFDRVLLMHAVAPANNNIIPIHVTEHYPGSGIAQVDFNLVTGEANVPYYDIK